jgi:hypothetical protein
MVLALVPVRLDPDDGVTLDASRERNEAGVGVSGALTDAAC